MTGILSLLSGLFTSSVGAADYQVGEPYSGLRNMLFSTKAESLGIKLKDANEAWGVVMETGYPEGVATLVVLADGTVSLYFSNGGGVIGLGPHEGPRKAGQLLLATSQRFAKQLAPTTVYPLPKRTYTRFYLLTGNGARTTEIKEDDLGNNRHALSPLFHSAHEVISAIRMDDQKRRAE